MEQIPTEVRCLIDALNKQIKELEIECEGQEKYIAELKAENERLKGLINDEFAEAWMQNEFQFFINSSYRTDKAREKAKESWQQFKTENNL